MGAVEGFLYSTQVPELWAARLMVDAGKIQPYGLHFRRIGGYQTGYGRNTSGAARRDESDTDTCLERVRPERRGQGSLVVGRRRSRNPQAAKCAERDMHISVLSGQHWARHHAFFGLVLLAG
jgi:hypothetical protein